MNLVILQASLEDDAAVAEIHAMQWHSGTLAETYAVNVHMHETETKAGNTSLDQALPELLRFCKGYALASYEWTDTHQILHELIDNQGYEWPELNNGLDIRSLAGILLPLQRDLSLAETAVALSIEAEMKYDPQIVPAVLSALKIHSEQLPYVTLQQLTRLGAMYAPSISEWFSRCSEIRYALHGDGLPVYCDSIQQMAFTAVETDTETEGKHSSSAADPPVTSRGVEDPVHASGYLDDASPITDLLPGFQVRPGQLEMVRAVEEALQNDSHLLVEAGTGTGKSLAYLIPAALYARDNDTRVVVSTHTIALQDQIESRDFPVLRKLLGDPIVLSIFKGRTHYVCMRKLHQEVRNSGFGFAKTDLETYMKLLVWLTVTATGDREELALSGAPADVWPRVQSETETCINKRCPFFKPCYYFRARSRAYEADVIVTNHSLVFSDLKANHRVLPRYDKLILDEAHHLEDQATKHLGEEVYQFHLLSLIQRLVRDNGKRGVIPELLGKLDGYGGYAAKSMARLQRMSESLLDMRVRVERAFNLLDQLVPDRVSEYRLTASVNSQVWQKYLQAAKEMVEGAAHLEEESGQVAEIAEYETDADMAARLLDAAGFLQEVIGKVRTLCSADDLSDEWVVWIEVQRTARRQVALHRSPIDVAKILRETLFATKSSAVLTSATLSIAGKFDYVKERIGLKQAESDGRLAQLSVGSPFKYEQQALLCIPKDVPELAKMSPVEAATWLSDSIYQLGKASGGRLLTLFTSHAMLRATADMLREPLQSAGLRLFAQGVDGSRTTLLENFRRQPDSILLGAQSFWEGIDLPGDQLTTLVIVRLPFAPPTHPVTEARYERIEAEGRSSFAHASLPEAVVRFRQGFGRLIRTVHDRGVVVVYDKRIVTARYGSTFIRSLDGVKPYVAEELAVISKVRTFLNQREASAENAFY